MESENPSWYIQKRKTKHRPPSNKSKIISGQNAKKNGESKEKEKEMKGRNINKQKSRNEEGDEEENEEDKQLEEKHLDEKGNENKLQRKLNIAADIVEGKSIGER